jgi:hypothetical protein
MTSMQEAKRCYSPATKGLILELNGTKIIKKSQQLRHHHQFQEEKTYSRPILNMHYLPALRLDHKATYCTFLLLVNSLSLT